MKELVEYIARALVDNPDQVQVIEVDGEKSNLIELRVAPEDMGKVIGKQGKIAQSIRTLTKATAAKEGKRVTVEIMR
ncbi:MAG TPA: KH domain-containing protein [Syntrophomonas sp.]|nr:KH domain-containing protein [Syntrophomonas sp.]HRW13276.1 KH domain-containing protein [Syntrophomonas sp.]